MTYPLNISDSDRQHILESYGLFPQPEKNYIKERLAECKFTKDGKYVLFEDNVYSTETGELVPITEKWTLSDTFHTVGDLLSAGLDFVIPGSGAIVDTLNAISYVIEAQFKKNPAEKMMLYVLGAITFAFVIIPGPLQAAAIPLKTFVKTGKGVANPLVRAGIKIIEKNLSRIARGIPEIVSRALKTRLGRTILGKQGSRAIAQAIKEFGMEAQVAIARAFKTKTDDEIKLMAEKVAKYKQEYQDALTASGGSRQRADRIMKLKRWNKAGQSVGKGVAKTLSALERKKLAAFFKNPISHMQGQYIIKKLGIAKGYTYGYLTKSGKALKATVIKGSGNGVLVKLSNGAQTWMTIDQFLLGVIQNPVMVKVFKGQIEAVPVFIKRLAELILPDGSGLDTIFGNTLPDLSPSDTSLESLEWLRSEMVSDEVKTSKQVDPTTLNFQKALVALGYSVGDTGADGVYGPTTKKTISQFQIDNRLEDTNGDMNRVTAKELAIELKKKRIEPELQQILFNL